MGAEYTEKNFRYDVGRRGEDILVGGSFAGGISSHRDPENLARDTTRRRRQRSRRTAVP